MALNIQNCYHSLCLPAVDISMLQLGFLVKGQRILKIKNKEDEPGNGQRGREWR